MIRRWSPRPAAKRAALLGTLLFISAASAHATLVLGALRSDPAAPRPGAAFSLTLDLVDPTQVPVEDAWVLAEFRPQGAPAGTEPVATRFEETETAGVYRAQISLPKRGAYTLLLRDQTYRQEEAQAELSFRVGRPTPPEGLSFVFPPTATGPQGLRTWLLWLVGLPLLAGVGVTVLVLTRGPGDAAKAPPPSPGEGT